MLPGPIQNARELKKFLYYLLTCVIIAVVLTPMMNGVTFTNAGLFLMTVGFATIYPFAGLYGSIWLFRFLDRKYDWLKDLWKRLLIGLIVVEIWSIVIYLVLTPLILMGFKGDTWAATVVELKKHIFYPVIMAPTGMLIIATIEFFSHWKAAYLRQEKLNAEMMAFKYEALHNQLNPHFLFNSFNVLSSLVTESPDLATRFIDQLSDLYQRVLNNKDKGLIPLAEELDFIKSYIFLLKTRFDEKIEIQVDVDAEQDDCIAPMVLQLLIENAVKHNSISKSEPLLITIKREGDVIETRNKIRLKRSVETSKATGLHNIQQRYSFFTDRQVEVNKQGNDFVVRIPLLKREAA